MDGLHDLGGKQGFGRVKYPSAPHNESWRPLVRGDRSHRQGVAPTFPIDALE